MTAANSLAGPPLWISQSALDYIERSRRDEGAEGLLVSIQEYAIPIAVSPDSMLGRALTGGTDDAVRAAWRETVGEKANQLERTALIPEFWERDEVETDHIVTISGLEMCMEQSAVEALRGWVLDLGPQGLFFRRDNV